MICGQYLGLCIGIPASVEKFVPVHIHNKHVKETFTVLPVEKMTEVFYITLFTLSGYDAVSHVIMTFVSEHSLRLYLILNMVKIVGILFMFRLALLLVSAMFTEYSPVFTTIPASRL